MSNHYIENERKNFIITVCLFFDDIDTTSINMNKYENLILKKINNAMDCKFFILWNASKLLSNINNNFYFIHNKLIKDGDKDAIIINMNSLDFNLRNVHLYKEILDPKNKIKDDFIFSGFINASIKITIACRIKLWSIVYKKSKNSLIIKEGDVNVNKVKYTLGNSLVIDSKIFNKFNKYCLDFKPVNYVYDTVKFKKDIHNTNCHDFINNEMYTSPIWISNFNNNINLKDKKYDFLKEIKIDAGVYLSTINYLNSCGMTFCKLTYTLVYKFLDHNMVRDKLKSYFKSLNSSENYISLYNEFMYVRGEILRLSNLRKFYLNYKYDRRHRIYVQPWPINYQQNRIVRCCIKFADDNDGESTYSKFFRYLKDNDFDKIFAWHFNKLDCHNLLLNFIDTRINEQEYPVKKLNTRIPYEMDALCHCLIKLAPSNIIHHKDKLRYAIYNFDELIFKAEESLKEANIGDLSNKEILDTVKNILNIKNLLSGDSSGLFWMDASSNAFQLIVLSSGTKSKKLLKLLNIMENDTGYKNIYYYVLDSIKKGDNFLKQMKSMGLGDEIEVDLVKKILMPSVYGKTMWASKETVIEHIKSWYNIKKTISEDTYKWAMKNINIISKEIYTGINDVCQGIGLNLRQHIQECRENFTVENFKNHSEIPIIFENLVPSKRHDIIKEIKLFKFIKNKLENKMGEDDSLGLDELLKTWSPFLNKKNIRCGSIGGGLTCLEKIKARITKLEHRLEMDDLTSIKKKIYVNKKTYQVRISSPLLLKENEKKNINSAAPNIIHSYDSYVLINTINDLKSMGVGALCIHDAIGVPIKYVTLVNKVYKINLIKTVRKNIKSGFFPYQKNIDFGGLNIEHEIFNSDTLFC